MHVSATGVAQRDGAHLRRRRAGWRVRTTGRHVRARHLRRPPRPFLSLLAARTGTARHRVSVTRAGERFLPPLRPQGLSDIPARSRIVAHGALVFAVGEISGPYPASLSRLQQRRPRTPDCRRMRLAHSLTSGRTRDAARRPRGATTECGEVPQSGQGRWRVLCDVNDHLLRACLRVGLLGLGRHLD